MNTSYNTHVLILESLIFWWNKVTESIVVKCVVTFNKVHFWTLEGVQFQIMVVLYCIRLLCIYLELQSVDARSHDYSFMFSSCSCFVNDFFCLLFSTSRSSGVAKKILWRHNERGSVGIQEHLWNLWWQNVFPNWLVRDLHKTFTMCMYEWIHLTLN